MPTVKEVIKKVKKNTAPSETEKSRINAIIKFSQKAINKKLKEEKINAEVLIGGSVAKKTWLNGQHDIDLFVKFSKKYKNKNIGKLLKKAVKSVFDKVTVLRGTRDYCLVKYKNYDLEFVPVLEVKKPSDAKNSMDASLFHVKYVKKKISKKPELAKEIRVMKSFAKAQGIYGAETHISGLSGYVSELLMIHYKSFENMIKKAEEMSPPIFIDLEKHYKNKEEIRKKLEKPKLRSPIVLIDPVFKQRNAAAALNREKFSKLVFALRMFSRKPKHSCFKKKELKLSDLKSRSKKRKTLLITKKIKLKQEKEDIFLAKLEKVLKRTASRIKAKGASVYDYGYLKENKKITIYFEMETIKISKFKKHKGPPVWIKKDHFNDFIKKWKKVYVAGVCLTSDVKRENKNVRKLVSSEIEKGIKSI